MEPIIPPTNLPPELMAAAVAELKAQAEAPPSLPMSPVSDEGASAEPVRVGPLTFRAPVLGDVETLRLLGSPYHQRFLPSDAGAGLPAAPAADLGALVDAVFLWTMPPRDCLVLAGRGAAAFRHVSSLSAHLVDAPLGVVRVLLVAVDEVIARGVA